MREYSADTDYCALYMAALTTAPAALEVKLESFDRLDDIEERTFILEPDSTVPIGRSSKNSNKKLTAARDNAYIDSPVISRDHATLSSRPAEGEPSVFITDNGSMHGTLVNSRVLPRRAERKLDNGDVLQFGVDVIRDQETFIAKQYIFSSRPAPSEPDRIYFRGISVPEPSDDEVEPDVTIVRPSPRPHSQWGSQNNPVTVEDFEEVPLVEIHADEDEDDLPPEVASSKAPVDDKETEKPRPIILDLDKLAEDYGSDDEVPLDVDDDAESINSLAILDTYGEEEMEVSSSLDGSTESESEDSGIEEDEDLDNVRREKLGAMLDHEQQKSDSIETPSSPPPALPPRTTFAPGPTTLPRPSGLFDSFSPVDTPLNWGPMSQPPLPPRPSAPKPYPYAMSMPSNSITEVNVHNPWYEDPPVNMFGMPMSEFSLPAFNRSSPPFPVIRPFNAPELPGAILRANNPPAPPKPEAVPEPQSPTLASASTDASPRSADEASSTTPQSSPRTKVSIAEIVEEAPEQPPTPTSMAATPSLKRKAEFLDADEDETSEETVTPEAEQTARTAPVSAHRIERPKKKARKPRSSLFQYATGAVVGAAAVVGGLLFVPEAWLQPGL